MFAMKNSTKYRPCPPIDLPGRRWPSRTLTQPPVWCSVDLRDGNQALVTPMTIEQKLRFFDLLVAMGFKEIEIGFPAASAVEFAFCRRLIDESRIPADVTVQALTQARAHVIERTMEALEGAPRAIVHVYNSTSPAQRELVFGASVRRITEIAVEGAAMVRRLAAGSPTPIVLEYSPESFSQTEPEVARDICDAVVDAWSPGSGERVILNLPATVEAAPPNVHADQIEWFIRNVRNRDRVIISVHTHNDRGCAVAAAELAQLAGARRVEGTLFGNGERTGNVDLITLALNLYSQGIDPGVDIRDINEIARIYEDCTGMSIHPRHPYAGELVYTAFSGSHQDAISKGLAACRGAHTWRTPYLPIDPEDIGRGYEAVVRINSQSGKGGAAYVLERTYGYRLPRTMHPDFGAAVQRRADESGTELTARELLACFEQEYLDTSGPLSLEAIQYAECVRDECRSEVSATLVHAETRKQVNGKGNGALDALTHGLRDAGYALEIVSYDEHSLGSGSDARAVAYIHITSSTGSAFGAGRDTDIAAASAKALISALNRAIAQGERCGRASVRSDSPVAARGDRSPA